MKITFHGGARSVTGANHLLQAGGLNILVDCGLFQGSRFSEEWNYSKFAYDPASIDYVFISHSHADHVGRLPKLYKDGFRGVVYASEPTRGIVEVALPDTLDKIEQEAKEQGHEPMYTEHDYHGVMSLFQGLRYSEPLALNEKVTVTLHEASHVLGSSLTEFAVQEEGQELKRIVFTGDLGNPPTLLLNPIDYVNGADYAVIESAYGNRTHVDRDQRQNILERTIEDTVTRGGVCMIPSFAIERTQQIMLELDELFSNNRIPKVPVFVDSPLAINITRVYGQYSHYFNVTAMEMLRDNKGLFNFPWLTMTPTSAESKRINETAGPKIIIAGSGMSTGGRILHHELRYLPDPKSTILFVGYQVSGSLGRRIQDGDKRVRIFGQEVRVNCHVQSIPSYSAHADQAGLLKFVEEAAKGKKLKMVFTVQGEEDGTTALAGKVKEQFKIEAHAPETGQSFDL